MSLPTLVTALNSLAIQSPLMFLIADLSLKATVILMLAGMLQLCWRRKSASERGTFWVFVIGALLFLPLFHFMLPGFSITLTIDQLELSRLLSNELLALISDLQNGNAGLAALLETLAVGYVVVSLLLILYLGIGLVRVALLTRAATPCRDRRVRSVLRRLVATNGIPTSITVLVGCHSDSPLTWGIGRHWLILPRTALQWDHDMLEQSLSHELAHIKRLDWLCYIASRLAICLYWINPMIWLAHNKLVIESEKACDDAVLSDTGCSISYAENLLELANRQGAFITLPAPALFTRPSSLVQRIRYILQEKNHAYDDRCQVLPGLLLAAVLVAPWSAIGITLHANETHRADTLMFRVNYFPKESSEYQRYMYEIGHA
jgi:beta-lactamase regulating signal transducer with metallopeptidase domain